MVKEIRNKDRCDECGHMPHAPSECLNMASDNDYSCTASTDQSEGGKSTVPATVDTPKELNYCLTCHVYSVLPNHCDNCGGNLVYLREGGALVGIHSFSPTNDPLGSGLCVECGGVESAPQHNVESVESVRGWRGLKPCPFDGHDAFVQENTSTSGTMISWQIRCTCCGVGGEVWGDKNKAIKAWNSRITDVPAAFQDRVYPWLLECFRAEISNDREERNHRFLEESLELVQACGCSRGEALQLVDYVYGRKVGEPSQEVGGVMITLAALCLANGFDMHHAGETELARIWTKVDAIRAKQAAKPRHSPLPEAVAIDVPTAELIIKERKRAALIAETINDSIKDEGKFAAAILDPETCIVPLSGGGTGLQPEHVFDNGGQCVYCAEYKDGRIGPSDVPEWQPILALVKTWVEAKAEYYRFGREGYAHKSSPLYAKEHNLSLTDGAALAQQVRATLDELNDAEHKAMWAVYEKGKEVFITQASASAQEVAVENSE